MRALYEKLRSHSYIQKAGVIIAFLLGLSHTPEYEGGTLFTSDMFALPEMKPNQDYINPVSLDVDLAGNFGEIRPGYFHSGIDIRTKGTRGWPVFTIADGYVSRIKVKATGFGNTLYIAHPDGYTSVYAHLKRFIPEIQQFVKKVQYRKESFEVDIRPNRQKFRFEQGDTIAFSGNSGSSQGPHLHFEVRQSSNQKPVNPLKYGYNHITDKKSPIIAGVGVYNFHRDPKTETYQQAKDRFFYTQKRYGKYRAEFDGPLKVCRYFGIGISTYDMLHKFGRQMGAYAVRLYMDDSLRYEHEFDKFSFSETRYVNAHIDYSSKIRRGVEYQRCFVLPGNRLSIYKRTANHGILEISDQKPHKIRVEVEDAHGHVSKLVTKVQKRENCQKIFQGKEHDTTVFHYDHRNTFQRKGVRVTMPRGALYNSIYFKYKRQERKDNDIYAPIHKLHSPYTPIHEYYTLKIKPTDLPAHLRHKALIAQSHYLGQLSSEGGEWQDGYVVSRVRQFGKFTVAIDTIAPDIRLLNIYEGKNMRHRKAIRVTIQDNLSGIQSFRGTVDGQWILMEYNAKYNLLKYVFDEHVGEGEHTFRLKVTDWKNNTAFREVNFER